jgi:hypothetical protein
MKQATSPTQNTLKTLRKSGYIADIAEYWNSFSRKRKDLFGFIDIVAVVDSEFPEPILAIQATSYGNISARVKKIKGIPAAKRWLQSGGKIEVWGWHKVGARYQVRTRPVTLEDFTQ